MMFTKTALIRALLQFIFVASWAVFKVQKEEEKGINIKEVK